ncbi:hypothetical protein HPB50_006237 [Hyalomma asiaticum]|uniref:Uncharacterized protein n=1 Tax=Hyalomma asiaticum TaxID=266040 RepID=A0ACB7TF94_HYAAI|nr:hypothetical protein HPB50_006237 [Hyalomma asiaticum]
MKLLQEQVGHMCDASFAGVRPTVQFMDTVHRWFVLMDIQRGPLLKGTVERVSSARRRRRLAATTSFAQEQ